MNVSDFGFDLPAELIAQAPAAERGASRLLVLLDESSNAARCVEHTHVSRLAEFLREGDLLVVNDTRVFPARLLGARVPSGGAVECLLLANLEDKGPSEGRWDALVHPGQKLQPGAQMIFRGTRHVLHGEVLERHFHGRRTIRLWSDSGSSIEDAIDDIGHMPLPPYIKREDTTSDRDRYQTVYARERGSVAAPTAGLHFTPELLDNLEQRGVERTAITLHVGYGTFQPVRVDQVEAHTIDAERFSISEAAADAINRAKRDEAPHRRGRHDHDARAGGSRPGGARRHHAAVGLERPVHLSGIQIRHRRCADDELPPAGVVAADARVRVRRPRCRARRVPRSGRAEIPLL